MQQMDDMQLPEDFIIRTKALLGDEWEAFEYALREESPVSIRTNPRKPAAIACPEAIAWASDAYYLPERPLFTLDPLFHAGAYYVQEASSMYLEQIVKNRFSSPVKALDLCAAPGGKSTHLLSLLPDDSLLVANEVISSRSKILAENLIKWGNSNVIVTNNDPKAIGSLSGCFDLILADVPCSGEGMFRKDPAAIGEWSVNNVRLCAERQRRIVGDVWPSLKPGGVLVYSTCTYNREENEENIAWVCEELGAEMLTDPHRFFPHKTKGEGFFIAALQKNETSQKPKAESRKSDRRSSTKQLSLPSAFNYVRRWLKDDDAFYFSLDSNRIIAFPKSCMDSYRLIANRLKLVSAGICLGEIKGKDLIPDHSLAMSVALNDSAFPRCEVDKQTALHYLHKETLLDLPDDLPKGYLLLTHQNLPLGFIKNIGNRINNLYPSEWRIRMNIKLINSHE